VRAGGDHGLVGAVIEHLLRRHLTDAEMDLDIVELRELDLPIGDHPAPLRAARVTGDELPQAAELLLRLAQMHVIATHSQNPGALHAGGSAADHENRAGLLRRLEPLRMPAAAVFLARGRVLGAAQERLLLHPGDAHIAADTFADVVVASLFDLLGQERVGDRGPRRADDVALTAVDRFDHVVRAREAAVIDDRQVADDVLDLLDEGLHPVRLAEARAARVLAPFLVVADLHRPGVEQPLGVKQLDDREPLLVILQAELAQKVVGLVADRDRARSATRFPQRGQALDAEAQPVLERTAPAVGAVVVAVVEELRGHGVVADRQFENIEARVLGALGGEHIHLDERLDVVLVAFGAVDRALREDVGRQAARVARDLAGFHARRVAAAVPELDAGERAVLVQLIAHMAVIDDVAVVPHPPQVERVLVRFGMNRCRLVEDRAPAALGLHAPEARLGSGPLGAVARAVGRLPETVFQGLRAEFNRGEEDVVFRVACH
jgi:hypothetical protein